MLKVQSGVVLFTTIFLCTGLRVKGETQVALLLQNVQNLFTSYVDSFDSLSQVFHQLASDR